MRTAILFAALLISACSSTPMTMPDASTTGLVCEGMTLKCGDRCVDPLVDRNNCGSCNDICPAKQTCVAGKCSDFCPYTVCSGACVSTDDDPKNCGACGKVCPAANGVATCAKGVCQLACTTTFADCDGDPSNGCEVDLSADGKNCGKCKRDCLGGACAATACQPVVLATGEAGARGITLDANNVYFGNISAIRKIPKMGGSAVTLTTFTSPVIPNFLTIDANNLYWSTATYTGQGSLQYCPLGNCSSPTTLAAGEPMPMTVAVDATNVYWSNANGGVRKCAIAGCGGSPTTLVNVWSLALSIDANNVYYTSSNGIFSCALGGCNNSPTLLASNNSSPMSIAVDASTVYWVTNTGLVAKCAKGGCSNAPTELVNLLGPALESVVYDTNDVYYISPFAGSIQKCAAAGCNKMPTVLAANQQSPMQIASDSTAIYWTDQTFPGQVLKLAK
jgi:hypothetical protein